MTKVVPEIQFMGSTVAHCMHEVQNILAIIHESAGLIEDIFLINPNLQFQHRPKIEETLAGIKEQVQRGKIMLHATSKLGHSIDEPLREACDLNAYMQIATILAQRMARLRGAKIVCTPTEEALPVQIGALTVLIHIYLALEWAVGEQGEDRTIQLYSEAGDKQHKVIIIQEDGHLPRLESLGNLQVILSDTTVEAEGNSLTLYFPANKDESI